MYSCIHAKYQQFELLQSYICNWDTFQKYVHVNETRKLHVHVSDKMALL